MKDTQMILFLLACINFNVTVLKKGFYPQIDTENESRGFNSFNMAMLQVAATLRKCQKNTPH